MITIKSPREVEVMAAAGGIVAETLQRGLERDRGFAEDRFAPAPPRGLIAIQEGGAVRLFWDPNGERDLVGYRVFRMTGDGAWVRIGDGVLAGTLFLDRDVAPGHHLAYRVSAVDGAEPPNESAPSEAVTIDVTDDPAIAPGGKP